MYDKLRSPAYELLRQRLYDARVAAGLTQKDLSRALQVSQQTISAFETGTRYMEVIELIHWARAVKLDPHALLDALIAVDEE